MGEVIKFPEKKPLNDAARELKEEGVTPQSLRKKIQGKPQDMGNVKIESEKPDEVTLARIKKEKKERNAAIDAVSRRRREELEKIKNQVEEKREEEEGKKDRHLKIADNLEKQDYFEKITDHSEWDEKNPNF